MIDRCAEGDAATTLLERRWFAAATAARNLQTECAVLREVVELAEGAWQQARSQLTRLEALRDALGEELAERDALHEALARACEELTMSSAA